MSGINYQALREAAQNYQSMLAWYQEKPDSPNAEQDCDAALAAFKREIRHREVDIIA
ncbi:ead/Ea22-like family protein, partial [Escherichia coli]